MRSLIFRQAIALVLASVLGLSAATAKTIATAKDMQEGDAFAIFLSSTGHGQVLALLAKQFDSKLGEPCTSDYGVKATRLELVRPITMTADDLHPTAGKWFERYSVTRCGFTSFYNALFEVTDDGALEGRVLIPGRTGQRAWLVEDLIPAIVQAAKIDGCDAVNVADTRRGIPEGMSVDMPGGDYEIWTLRGCGQDVVLALRFETAASGDRVIKIEQEVSRGPSTQRW